MVTLPRPDVTPHPYKVLRAQFHYSSPRNHVKVTSFIFTFRLLSFSNLKRTEDSVDS